MHVDALIRMANQIGGFFEAMPDRAEAQENAARHIKSYWEPRMRRALLTAMHAGDAAALSPFMADAMARHRCLVEPAAQAG